jgi:FixJ family two-component response regulator
MHYMKKPSSSLVESNTCDKQAAHLKGLRDLFESMGFEVMSFTEAEQQAALEETKKPWCDCDPIINGKTGRICQTHLLQNFNKYLKRKLGGEL